MTAIDCIKVNIDYESVLFHGKSGPPVMNEALEFLAFYLQDLPVFSTRNYSDKYLNYVQSLSGRKPSVVRKGNFMNWWGPLENRERERWMNSKLTSTEFSANEGWSKGFICERGDLENLDIRERLLVKDPFNMSGRGLVILEPGKPAALPSSMTGKLIVEPLLKRRHDFSHFVFPDGNVICYENLVDDRFQYRGTLFSLVDDFSLCSLSFSKQLSWETFRGSLKKITDHYGTAPFGYSVDSFTYEEDGQLKIYPLCEVNARRTMGLLAYELTKLLGSRKKKAALSLKGPIFQDAIRLSPEDVRFDVYLSFE